MPRIKKQWLLNRLHRKVWNALEIADVAGKEDSIHRECGRSDCRISELNPVIAPQIGRNVGHRFVERHYRSRTDRHFKSHPACWRERYAEEFCHHYSRDIDIRTARDKRPQNARYPGFIACKIDDGV